jgi:predicted transcriptional regulator
VSTTIRVSDATRDRLARLAKTDRRPMTSILEDALDALERRRFFETFNLRYGELRSDHDSWNSIESERRIESSSLADSNL